MKRLQSQLDCAKCCSDHLASRIKPRQPLSGRLDEETTTLREDKEYVVIGLKLDMEGL